VIPQVHEDPVREVMTRCDFLRSFLQNANVIEYGGSSQRRTSRMTKLGDFHSTVPHAVISLLTAFASSILLSSVNKFSGTLRNVYI
jgi:hypothetical protein